jgi:alpha-amylase
MKRSQYSKIALLSTILIGGSVLPFVMANNKVKTIETSRISRSFNLLNNQQVKYNDTMIQFFDWETKDDGTHWDYIASQAGRLNRLGISSAWIPPAYKGHIGSGDAGYGVYDLYDLGEFDQKGSVRTRYGTFDQLKNATRSLKNNNIKVYADVVLNHMLGADDWETVPAYKVDSNNRNRDISGEYNIGTWTKFDFPGRNNKYSDFKWRWYHFDGVDYDHINKESGSIWRLKGLNKYWDSPVDNENGNYDYLLGADVDLEHPEVVEEFIKWGTWFQQTLDLDGFRLDAVKHMKFDFFKTWMNEVRKRTGRSDLYAVGEYMAGDVGKLHYFNDVSGNVMNLFDFPLYYNFETIDKDPFGNTDLGSILWGNGNNLKRTYTKDNKFNSVTFVDNHDTYRSSDPWHPGISNWFKPAAYNLIMTMRDGLPAVFSKDLENPQFTKAVETSLMARKLYAYGEENSYFDNADVVGWTRTGDDAHFNSGLAGLISDRGNGSKWMDVGKRNIGKKFVDITGNHPGIQVTINNDGWGEFLVKGRSSSLWVPLSDVGVQDFQDLLGSLNNQEISLSTSNDFTSLYEQYTNINKVTGTPITSEQWINLLSTLNPSFEIFKNSNTPIYLSGANISEDLDRNWSATSLIIQALKITSGQTTISAGTIRLPINKVELLSREISLYDELSRFASPISSSITENQLVNLLKNETSLRNAISHISRLLNFSWMDDILENDDYYLESPIRVDLDNKIIKSFVAISKTTGNKVTFDDIKYTYCYDVSESKNILRRLSYGKLSNGGRFHYLKYLQIMQYINS